MNKAKEEELKFYKMLRLEKEEKKRIFQVDEEIDEYPKRKGDKVIVWDPLKGNLIMT